MSERRKVARKVVVVLAGFIAALVVLAALLPAFSHVSERSPETVQLSNLKQMALILREYAENHEGKYPLTHFSIVTEDLDPELWHYRDPKTHALSDWLYFAGHHDDESGTTILMAAPRTFVGKRTLRVVLFRDCSAQIMRESDYQNLLAAQVSGYDPGVAR